MSESNFSHRVPQASWKAAMLLLVGVVALAFSAGCTRTSATATPAAEVAVPVHAHVEPPDAPLPDALAGWSKARPARGDETPERGTVHWYEGGQLLVEGRGWQETHSPWHRLPIRAQKMVPPLVWGLSQQSAGIAVRFATDSSAIHAIWSGGVGMNHMPASGVSGLDLYRREADGSWRFAGVGRPAPQTTTATLHRNEQATGEFREYLLFLPLYAELTQLEIGVESTARIAIPPPDTRGLLVFYGTSITQGGCASRTGMAYPAILRRWFDRPAINLGFSGAGRMELELADLLGELDAAIYVLNCVPNMVDELVEERVEPFVRRLREHRPDVPILLVEDLRGLERNELLRAAYENLRAEGIEDLHYMTYEPLLAGEEEGTVDGVHPTDLGFLRMARALRPVIAELIEGR